MTVVTVVVVATVAVVAAVVVVAAGGGVAAGGVALPNSSNFNTNTSSLPADVRLVMPVPGSKSTVSMK